MLKFLKEDVGADGSYAALVNLYGCEYAVHYIAGEVRVYATREMARNWKTRKNPETVKKMITAKLEAMGPEFAAAHAKLYAEEA